MFQYTFLVASLLSLVPVTRTVRELLKLKDPLLGFISLIKVFDGTFESFTENLP